MAAAIAIVNAETDWSSDGEMWEDLNAEGVDVVVADLCHSDHSSDEEVEMGAGEALVVYVNADYEHEMHAWDSDSESGMEVIGYLEAHNDPSESDSDLWRAAVVLYASSDISSEEEFEYWFWAGGSDSGEVDVELPLTIIVTPPN